MGYVVGAKREAVISFAGAAEAKAFRWLYTSYRDWGAPPREAEEMRDTELSLRVTPAAFCRALSTRDDRSRMQFAVLFWGRADAVSFGDARCAADAMLCFEGARRD